MVVGSELLTVVCSWELGFAAFHRQKFEEYLITVVLRYLDNVAVR
jgi:hypothetical protein